MPDRDTIRNRLLAVIAVLLVIAGLRWSYPVTMPLAVATFVVATIWPVKVWLEKVLPVGVSYMGTVLILLLVFAGFFVAVYLSIAQVVQVLVLQNEAIRQVYETYAGWASARGLPVTGGAEGYARAIGIAQMVLAQAYAVLVYLGFIAILVIFGLPEVPSFRRKAEDELHGSDRREAFEIVGEMAAKFRSYFGVMLLTSLLTGVASAVWAFAMGLELALTWGVLNFLLNFIPVIGNIVGIIPPSLYALLQFQDWVMAAIVFAGFTILQLAISYGVYPWLQGQGLSLSPAAILVSLAFWGWVWGPAGVLLAVPLTAATVITCEHFRSTEWIARLLSKG